MNEALNTILTAIIALAVPAVSGLAVMGFKYGLSILAAKVQNDTITRILNEISDAVEKAVASTSQTYVDALKSGGAFSEAAQKTALKMALDACLASLSQSAKDYITSTSGDLNQFLTERIEAEVKLQKISAPAIVK